MLQFPVGFEQLLNNLDSRNTNTFPPYDIISVDDYGYEIHLAVAGFSKDSLEIVVKGDVLTVSGKKEAKEDVKYIRKGIGKRNFSVDFKLDKYLEPISVEFKDGILCIYLEKKIPEKERPRQLLIGAA